MKMAVIEITKENCSIPVVLDFWGPRCNPGHFGRIKFCSVDTSKNKRVAVNMKVKSIPAFLFFNNRAGIENIRAKIKELT